MEKKQIVLPKAGDASIFRFETSEMSSELDDNSVLIKVHYSGINFADIHMRQGLYLDAPKFPFTPGYEVSGEVMAVGKNVDMNLVGKKVMAGTYFGGYSSHVKVPMSYVFPLENEADLQMAAATPVSYLTAYFSLFEAARIRQGDRLLVDCASGALGSTIAQLLNGLGVHLAGLTSSEEKKNYLKELGYQPLSHDEYAVSGDKFDVIINSRGGQSTRDDYEKLMPFGRLVCLGASNMIGKGSRNWLKVLKTALKMPKFSSIEMMNDNRGVAGINLLKIFEDTELIGQKMAQLEHFQYNAKVDKVFAASEVQKAHEYIEQKKSKGKVLLSWIE